jgi:hypothetical protein
MCLLVFVSALAAAVVTLAGGSGPSRDERSYQAGRHEGAAGARNMVARSGCLSGSSLRLTGSAAVASGAERD